MRNLIFTSLLATLLMGFLSAQGPVVEKSNLNLDSIRRLPVLEGGRKKPFDSLAREKVRRVTQKERFEKTDPVLLYLYWTFEPQKVRKDLIIALPEAFIASKMGFDLEQRVADDNIPNKLARWASYDEAMANKKVLALKKRIEIGSELTQRNSVGNPRA